VKIRNPFTDQEQFTVLYLLQNPCKISQDFVEWTARPAMSNLRPNRRLCAAQFGISL